jgi:alkaline phosphatase
MNINVEDTDKIFGLFSHSHLQYKLLSDDLNEPTLTEMTVKALDFMKKNNKGYVLLVEGGRIDHGHHATQAHLALEETLQFNEAIEYARNNTNEDDTLIVVTADHGHVFTVGGYPVSFQFTIDLQIFLANLNLVLAKRSKYFWRWRLFKKGRNVVFHS